MPLEAFKAFPPLIFFLLKHCFQLNFVKTEAQILRQIFFVNLIYLFKNLLPNFYKKNTNVVQIIVSKENEF